MSTTIEENISLEQSIPRQSKFWAGDLAGVSEFANRHPDGYKLKLRERGSRSLGDRGRRYLWRGHWSGSLRY